ncbi:MAG: TonB-dependent receptor [Opitutaceae bacterium]
MPASVFPCPRLVWRLLCRGLSCLVLAASLSAADAPRRTFDVPADSADKSIKRFSEQSGLEVFYASSVAEGVRTRGVKGEMTPREALDQMLAGTGLVVVQDEKTGAISLRKAGGPNGSRATPAPASARPSAGTTHGTGVIAGRVFNEQNGTYLRNAKLTIAGTQLETFTDAFGRFEFAHAPAGEVQVRAFYTGFAVQEKTLSVPPGGRTELNLTFGGVDDSTVQLAAFTVATTRFQSASATAINEQRFAQNIKTVVSADAFGDNSDGNLGEFVKYIPGVTLGFTGGQASTISIGGLPPESTPITIDGNRIASAAGETRAIQLDQISLNNMSQVEVERSQNADSPADAIGGSVNLVAKSAFERKKASYSAKAYAVFRDKALSDRTYNLSPSFEIGAIVPINDVFGFAASGTSSIQDSAQYISNQAWVPMTLAPSTNLPAGTSSQPYLGRYQYGDAPKSVTRQSAAFSADFRLSATDVLSISQQYGYFNEALNGVPRDQVIINPVRVTAFGPNSVQGATGAGTLQLAYSTRAVQGTTSMPSLRWRHTGPVWKLEANGAFSRSSYHDKSVGKGYFGPLNAFVRNVTVRFDDTGYLKPGKITVTNASGAAIDPSDLSNYLLESGGSAELDRVDIVRSVSAFAQRDVDWGLPFRFKAGADVRSQNRDIRGDTTNFTFVGADRTPRTADDSVAQWIDTSYLDREEPWGLPKRAGFNSTAVYNTFKQHPEYFLVSETDQVNSHRANVTTSKNITETIYASYLRLDFRNLLDNRLTVTAGLRYEGTDVEGVGPLINPNLIYQRDASGRIVLDSQGRPVALAALASLAGTKLAYQERGAKTSRSYHDFFPSANASYHLRPNLIARLAFARSIARPNFNNILPSISLPDETSAASKTITLTNPNLDPWIADSTSASLEYYFNEPSSGVVSVRGYRRDIADFWGAVTRPVSDDLLAVYGLDPNVYGPSLGYVVSTRENAGRARISGLELDFRETLAFLPGWGKNLSVFANLTLQHLEGSTTADFTNFVQKTINYGVSYSHRRFTGRIGVNERGRERRELFTGAGVESGTYNYLAPRTTVDVAAEFQITRRIAVFASVRNLFNESEDRQRYGPSTPEFAKLQIRTDYRPLISAGAKGSF